MVTPGAVRHRFEEVLWRHRQVQAQPSLYLSLSLSFSLDHHPVPLLFFSPFFLHPLFSRPRVIIPISRSQIPRHQGQIQLRSVKYSLSVPQRRVPQLIVQTISSRLEKSGEHSVLRFYSRNCPIASITFAFVFWIY